MIAGGLGPALDYFPLLAAAGLLLGLRGVTRLRARHTPASPDASLVQLRGRPAPPDRAGLLALAGLGFALALALVLFAPTAAICLSGETCPEGPALWVGSAGIALLGLAAAVAWPALTRAP